MPNAWRYRDWVVEAFNRDLPYDDFIVAQLAADLLPESERGRRPSGLWASTPLATETTTESISPDARCWASPSHAPSATTTNSTRSHKAISIPCRAYSIAHPVHNHPLAPVAEVEAYESAKKRVAAQKLTIDEFLKKERDQLIDLMIEQTADYLIASYRVQSRQAEPAQAAADAGPRP